MNMDGANPTTTSAAKRMRQSVVAVLTVAAATPTGPANAPALHFALFMVKGLKMGIEHWLIVILFAALCLGIWRLAVDRREQFENLSTADKRLIMHVLDATPKDRN